MRPLAALAALLALAACGRVGPVRAPGPPEAVIYPRAYPYIPPASRPGTPAPGTADEAGRSGDTPISRPGSQR